MAKLNPFFLTKVNFNAFLWSVDMDGLLHRIRRIDEMKQKTVEYHKKCKAGNSTFQKMQRKVVKLDELLPKLCKVIMR